MLTKRNGVVSAQLDRSSRHRGAQNGGKRRTRVANLFVGLGLVLIPTASCSDDPGETEPQPAHQSLPFLNLGCSDDSDCDDDDECTLDVCVANVACVNADILNCCLSNEECQTRLGCELAECVLGECVQFDPCETGSDSGATSTAGDGSGGAPIGVGLTVIGIGVTAGIGGGVGVTVGAGGNGGGPIDVGATVGVGGLTDVGATVGVGGLTDVGATVGVGGLTDVGATVGVGGGDNTSTTSGDGTSTTAGDGTSTSDGGTTTSGDGTTTSGTGGVGATGTTGAGTEGSGGTGGTTGSGGDSAAGGAPTTSSGTGGTGVTPCEEDAQCASDCVIGYCVNNLCATAPDPLCCDVPADCAGIRCATGECHQGRCELDCGSGVGGGAGEAGAAGQAGAESTAQGGNSTTQDGSSTGTSTTQGGSSTSQGGSATTTDSGAQATVNGGAGGTTSAGGATNGGNGEGGTAAQGGSGQNTTRGGSAGDGAGGSASDQPTYELRGGACSVGFGRPAHGLWALVGLLGACVWMRRQRTSASDRARTRRSGPKMLGLLVLVVLWFGAQGQARAQGSAVDEYPAPSAPDDLLWVERATPRPGALVPFGRLGLVYSKNPLVAEMSDGSEVSIIDQRLAFYGSAGVALADRFSGAVALPVYVQEGESLAGASDGASSGIGDVALDLRAAALTRNAPVEVGLGLGLQFPSGSQDDLSGERTTSARPRVIVSKAIGTRGSLVTGHVGSRVRGATDLGDVRLESELDLGVGGLWMFTDALGVSGELGLRTSYRDFFDEQETPASATGGVRYQRGWVVVHGGAGAGLSSGVGSPDFRLLAMIGVAPPVDEPLADRDGDGIMDAADECPDTPEDKDGVADTDGCPEDDDGDGVSDQVDACPKVAEDKDGFADADGCPDLDNDGDGIADANDACPTQVEDKDDFADEDGCPDPDNDQDGILDTQDQCPIEAEDKDGWKDNDGCAEQDNDGDGILDAGDKCPNEAETQNGVDDEDGCPDFIRVEQGEIRTLEPIFFQYGQVRIQQRSEPMLTEMARTIVARPDLGGISIEGHTDDRGGEEFNLRLSEGRAEAVRQFLIDAGVPAERVSSKGFGESKPIVSNATDAGRAKNRRVEFRFAFPEEAEPKETLP